MTDREDEIMDEVERQSRAATQVVRGMCHERGQDALAALAVVLPGWPGPGASTPSWRTPATPWPHRKDRR